jgi:hypothetical protein
VAYCCGFCLLSLSWALVLYSRACCLIRPGHLDMPPAALLCQLVWRAGMLTARVTSLMVFARVFNWWVVGVAGERAQRREYREAGYLWERLVAQCYWVYWFMVTVCTRWE